MANTMRWRYGDTNPVVLAVGSSTVIEIGDILWLDSGEAKPASALADQLSKAANQKALHDAFAGIALQQSRDGDTDPIRVATTGVFEFDCPSATFEVGDLIGVSEASGGTACTTRSSKASAPRTRPSVAAPAACPRPTSRCWSTSSAPFRTAARSRRQAKPPKFGFRFPPEPRLPFAASSDLRLPTLENPS